MTCWLRMSRCIDDADVQAVLTAAKASTPPAGTTETYQATLAAGTTSSDQVIDLHSGVTQC